MLIIECGRAEVNQPHRGVSHLPVTINNVMFGVLEENVLGLQVCVGQSVLVQEVYGHAEVVGDPPDLLQAIGVVGVVSQKIKDALPEHLECNASVSAGK